MAKEKSKLGQLIKDKGMTQKDFAEKVFTETGYFIALSNLCNYCSGYKNLKKVETAKIFAEVLQVSIEEIL